MLFFVFPKPFEFGKFLHELRLQGKLKAVSILPINATVGYAIKISPDGKRKSEPVIIWCIIVNESDIMFGADFLATVDEILQLYPSSSNRSYSEHSFLQVGTAGGFIADTPTLDPVYKVSVYDKDSLLVDKCLPPAVGTAHHIDCAFKIDRARLVDGPDGTVLFEPRLEKIAMKKVSSSTVKFLHSAKLLGKSRSVLCSNMLMESPNALKLLAGENSIVSSGILMDSTVQAIVDMETFDFFAVCESRNVECYGAIRLISDVCGDPLGSKIRSLVSFKNAVEMALIFATRARPVPSSIIDKLEWKPLETILNDYGRIIHDKVEKAYTGEYDEKVSEDDRKLWRKEYDRTVYEVQANYNNASFNFDDTDIDITLKLPIKSEGGERKHAFHRFLLKWMNTYRSFLDKFRFYSVDDDDQYLSEAPSDRKPELEVIYAPDDAKAGTEEKKQDEVQNN